LIPCCSDSCHYDVHWICYLHFGYVYLLLRCRWVTLICPLCCTFRFYFVTLRLLLYWLTLLFDSCIVLHCYLWHYSWLLLDCYCITDYLTPLLDYCPSHCIWYCITFDSYYLVATLYWPWIVRLLWLLYCCVFTLRYLRCIPCAFMWPYLCHCIVPDYCIVWLLPFGVIVVVGVVGFCIVQRSVGSPARIYITDCPFGLPRWIVPIVAVIVASWIPLCLLWLYLLTLFPSVTDLYSSCTFDSGLPGSLVLLPVGLPLVVLWHYCFILFIWLFTCYLVI